VQYKFLGIQHFCFIVCFKQFFSGNNTIWVALYPNAPGGYVFVGVCSCFR